MQLNSDTVLLQCTLFHQQNIKQHHNAAVSQEFNTLYHAAIFYSGSNDSLNFVSWLGKD